MTSTISVIIPTLNDKTLAKTLEALTGQSRAADEILVVGRDEAGTTKGYPQVRFLDTGRPVCAAAARNTGIANASGNIIAFTDSDCIPGHDWVENMERAHHQGAHVVGGGVVLEGPNYLAQCDNVSMFHDFVPDHPEGERRFLPTLNLSVQRQVINEIGYMDESFPGASGEDTDWTLRMSLAGYALLFRPRAVVRHAPTRTRWKDVVRHWRNCGYSSIRVRHRYIERVQTPNLTLRIIRSAFLLRFLSPIIAVWITAGIYKNPMHWRLLAYLPVVYLTKIIYCFGAAASIDSGFAFDPPGKLKGVKDQPGLRPDR